MLWKAPKGTLDLHGHEYNNLRSLVDIVEKEFTKNGGVPLETPVFERTDVLLGKYGEEADTKLVYNIEANGGEPLTLRYDLTIPFVRHVKENNVKKMRRYAIGKVYRRDQPNINSGRFREFYQADFDILGEDNDSMIAEATLLKMACNVLNHIDADYVILVNDIENLHVMLTQDVKVPNDLWKKLCPVIDKLDKQQFDTLIPEFLQVHSTLDVNALRNALCLREPCCESSMTKWTKLNDIANAWNFANKLQYTSSLARGLDYYSGFIWEVKLKGNNNSVVAGGRYDVLLGKSLVGISFGISRMLAYSNSEKNKVDDWTESMYVTTVGAVKQSDRMKVIEWAKQRWSHRAVLYSFSEKDRKLKKVIEENLLMKRRYIVIIAEDEWNSTRQVIVKDLKEWRQDTVCL